jgi:drug/metabolite transporter (DMT)-like permease
MTAHGQTLNARVVVAVGITLVVWASAFVFIRVALPDLNVAALTVGRLAVTSVALALLVPVLKLQRPSRADLPRFALAAVTGMLGYQLLLNVGERTVTAGTASLLMSTGPAFAAALAAVLLGERVTQRGVLGIFLGFAGASIIAISHAGGLTLSPGSILILGAAFSQALFFVVQRPLLARYSAFSVTAYATWAACLLSLPLLPWAWDSLTHSSAKALGAVIYLGIVPSAIGFLTWAYALARLPVATATNTLYLVPFIAIAIGWVLLGETVSPIAIAGGVLAMVGVSLTRPRRARLASEPG